MRRRPKPLQVEISEGGHVEMFIETNHGGDSTQYMKEHKNIWWKEIWDVFEGEDIAGELGIEPRKLMEATLKVHGLKPENMTELGGDEVDIVMIRGYKPHLIEWVIDWEEAAVDGGPRGADDDHADYFPTEWDNIGQIMMGLGILTQKDWDEWTQEIADRHYGGPGQGYYDEFISD